MSEQVPQEQDLTAGAMLRQARERAGLHIAALAVGMKVSVKKLEALEADRFESLGDPVFVRALASSMCRTLKVDPAPVLAKLPQYVKPSLGGESPSLNTPFRDAGAAAVVLPAVFKKPAFGVVALLLLAAVAVFLFPKAAPTDVPNGAPVEKAGADGAQSVPEPVFVPAPMIVASAPQGAASTPVTEANAAVAAPAASAAKLAASAFPAPAPAPAPATAPATAPVAAASVAAPKPAASATAAAASPAPVASTAVTANAGILVLRPKAASWVQVTDAKGVVQLRKTLQAGEVASVGGDLPLMVVLGRADLTVVEVRGKVLALEGISQDNVARFEVK